MLAKIHYISQGNSLHDHVYNIQQALDAGVGWIQLRIKNSNEESILPVAEQVKQLCNSYKATFVVNDFVEVARIVDADGVHLGLLDERISEARKTLGDSKIIGGTANTLDHVLQRAEEKCDYVGLGPFAFTPTKEKLSPILGLEGYKKITLELRKQEIQIPIIAIGGIQLSDVKSLLDAGVHGIAASGLLTTHEVKKQVSFLNQLMYVQA